MSACVCPEGAPLSSIHKGPLLPTVVLKASSAFGAEGPASEYIIQLHGLVPGPRRCPALPLGVTLPARSSTQKFSSGGPVPVSPGPGGHSHSCPCKILTPDIPAHMQKPQLSLKTHPSAGDGEAFRSLIR